MNISDKFASIPNSSLPSGILSSTTSEKRLGRFISAQLGLVTSYPFHFSVLSLTSRRDRWTNDLNSSPTFSLHQPI
jgi:hypothetical protein